MENSKMISLEVQEMQEIVSNQFKMQTCEQSREAGDAGLKVSCRCFQHVPHSGKHSHWVSAQRGAWERRTPRWTAPLRSGPVAAGPAAGAAWCWQKRHIHFDPQRKQTAATRCGELKATLQWMFSRIGSRNMNSEPCGFTRINFTAEA